MARTVLALVLVSGDVQIQYNDGSKASVKSILDEVKTTHKLDYGFELQVRGNTVHLGLPEAHFEKTDSSRDNPSHKGLKAARALVYTFDALVNAGIPEKQLQDHTYQRRNNELRPDVGIWINGVAGAGTGVTTPQGPNVQEQLAALVERFMDLNGDPGQVPDSYAKQGDSVLLAWYRREVSKLESAKAAQQVHADTPATAASTEKQPEGGEPGTGVSIDEM